MKELLGRLVGVIGGVVILLYVTALLLNSGGDPIMVNADADPMRHGTVAIFGATGTVGDGLLKAALNDPDVSRIHVITRRASPRIEEGIASGRVSMTIHNDYKDYAAIRDTLTAADAIFWAIGLSAVGLDEDTYREIHVEFPERMISEWLSAGSDKDVSFHYISGSGTSAESRFMWARVKAEAESRLSGLAENSNLRVISYRPSFVVPTEAEANIGHEILQAIFAPINSAVEAESIGMAMLEASARGEQVGNATVLENKDIVGLGKSYLERGRSR